MGKTSRVFEPCAINLRALELEHERAIDARVGFQGRKRVQHAAVQAAHFRAVALQAERDAERAETASPLARVDCMGVVARAEQLAAWWHHEAGLLAAKLREEVTP